MSLVDRLPFPPRRDESLRSLIVRVAEDNICTPSEISAWLGLPVIGNKMGSDPTDAATALGMDPQLLASMGFATTEGEAFLGHEVPVDMLFHEAFRYCPLCLAEAPYYRRVWDHKQFEACPHHRVVLLSECPACTATGVATALTWRRPSLLVCTNGHDLRDQEVIKQDGADGTASMHRYLGLDCAGHDLPTGFRELPLQPLLEVLFFLGRMEIVVGAGRVKDFKGHEMRTHPDILDAGVRIAMGWPDSFNALATVVGQRYPASNGRHKQYGSLQRFISASEGEPYGRLLRTAYSRFLACTDGISTADWPSFLPCPPEVPKAVTMGDALKILSPTPGSARSHLKRQDIWKDLTRVSRGNSSWQYFLEPEVLALRDRLVTPLCPAQVDTILGLGKRRTQKLCEGGLIDFTVGDGPRGRTEDRHITPVEVNRLVEQVLSQSLPRMPQDPIDFVHLLISALRRKTVSFADVLKAILNGQLRGYQTAADQPLFKSIVFEKKDLSTWLELQRSKTRQLRLGAVADALGVETEAVHNLVAAGLIAKPRRDETGVCRGQGYLFDPASVEAFIATYIFDFCLPRPARGRLWKIRDRLAAAGVEPVIVVRLSSGARTTAVYRRSEVALAMSSEENMSQMLRTASRTSLNVPA